MTTAREKAIADILEVHAEEAPFLWILRDRVVHQPHYSLTDLAELDQRINAHLDGLRAGSDEGWLACKEQLVDFGEPGEAFAAGVLAFQSGVQENIQTVLDIGAAKEATVRGLISALGWLPQSQAVPHIQTLLQSDNPAARQIAIGGSAVQRWNPENALNSAIGDDHPNLKARALRAAAELGRVDLLHAVCQALDSDDNSCKFWAAWSGALLGRDEKAVRTLRLLALENGPNSERSVQLLFRVEEPLIARKMIDRLRDKPETLRLAVIGTGALGDPEYIPWLIEQMATAEIARVAGESFTTMTGVDLASNNLDGESPENLESEAEDEDVEMDADENLPWPNAELIQKWWDHNRSKFSRGTRYLIGEPISEKSLIEILRTGMQRQRAAAALELALQKPGEALFEVRMPGRRQQQFLAAS